MNNTAEDLATQLQEEKQKNAVAIAALKKLEKAIIKDSISIALGSSANSTLRKQFRHQVAEIINETLLVIQ